MFIGIECGFARLLRSIDGRIFWCNCIHLYYIEYKFKLTVWLNIEVNLIKR